MDFAIRADHKVKLKENEKKDEYLDLARELEKLLENEGDVYTNYIWWSWCSHQRIDTEGLEHLQIRGRVRIIQTTALLRSA